MTPSNYDIMRNQMREEFVKHDQNAMIRKFPLEYDRDYIYIEFIRRLYRIHRHNGTVEWSDHHFRTVVEADYNESMTIYDVLCFSKENRFLSGRYCPLNMLKGTVKSSAGGYDFFQKAAESFQGRTTALEHACSVLGNTAKMSGDVAAELYPFSFLPVTLQYWEADDEFPAHLKFMVDENILDYLHYETIFFMLSHLIKRLKEISFNPAQNPDNF